MKNIYSYILVSSTLFIFLLFLAYKYSEPTYSIELQVLPGGINGVDDPVAAAQAEAIWNQDIPAGYTVETPHGTYVSGGGQLSSTPVQPSTPPASSGSGNTAPATPQTPQQPKVKILVWFTDMYGRVIGSSEITEGTTIASFQFPKSVEDIETPEGVYTFEKWGYDGRVIEHGLIVRAEYVK